MQNKPKTDEAGTLVRIIPGSNGAARSPLTVAAATAAQHAFNVVRSIKLFSAILGLVGIK
jgi:hypothetical protein